MEGLIIMLVMIAISSLFNKAKNKEQPNKQQPKQMPPFSSQPAPRTQETRPNTRTQNRPKTLEDFASEVFGQLNEKAKPLVQKVEEPIELELPKEAPVQPTRNLTERPLVVKLKQQSEGLQVVPRNNKELMQAIVMAEVLGPPKARRK